MPSICSQANAMHIAVGINNFNTKMFEVIQSPVGLFVIGPVASIAALFAIAIQGLIIAFSQLSHAPIPFTAVGFKTDLGSIVFLHILNIFLLGTIGAFFYSYISTEEPLSQTSPVYFRERLDKDLKRASGLYQQKLSIPASSVEFRFDHVPQWDPSKNMWDFITELKTHMFQDNGFYQKNSYHATEEQDHLVLSFGQNNPSLEVENHYVLMFTIRHQITNYYKGQPENNGEEEKLNELAACYIYLIKTNYSSQQASAASQGIQFYKSETNCQPIIT